MPAYRGRMTEKLIAVACLGAVAGVVPLLGQAQDLLRPAPAPAPATSAPFQPTPLQPSLVDFLTGLPVSTTMQEMAKPKLLRRGFAGEPLDSAKGLASKIKGQEKDVPNRKKAAKYLGSVDCQQFPESQSRLAELAQDPFEEVRYEAAKAFVVQYSRGWDEKPSKKEQRRKDTCRGCCDNVDILNTITKLAYQCDAQGCYYEPSSRVREKLQEAIALCSTCNTETSEMSAETLQPTPEKSGEAAPMIKSEDASPKPGEPKPLPKPKTAPPPEKSTTQLDLDGIELNEIPSSVAATDESATAAEEPAVQKTEVILIEESTSSPASVPLLPAEDVKLQEPAPSEDNAETEDLGKSVTARPVFEDADRSLPVITPTRFVSEAVEAPAAVEEPATKAIDADIKAPLLDDAAAAPAELILKKIDCLRGYCPVSMRARKLLKASDEIYFDLNGVRYCFANEEARAIFIATPSLFAPVLDGDCIVTYASTGKRTTGNFVLEFNGRQFWFETKEIREQFRAAPQQFIDQMNERSGAKLASRR